MVHFFSVVFAIIFFTSAVVILTTEAAPVGDISDIHTDIGDDREKRETFDMLDFLSKYGYLETPAVRNGRGPFQSDDVLVDAVKKFQRFTGLQVTGILDQETLAKMKAPRCGVSDIIHNSTNSNDGNVPMAFQTMGTRWMKDTVTWKPTRFTDQLSEGQQWAAFQKALDLWAEHIPIKFRYSEHEPDMEIMFARGDHGDGWQNKFDGRGKTLAHAYPPANGLGGDTHFDEDEYWTINTGEGTDLTFVAAHEFGHALGLAHSSVPGSLMAPYYRYSEDVSLHADDIMGIQALYGPKHRTVPTPQPATPTPTTPTTPTTTTTTTTEERPWFPDFCDESFRLDAISQGPDGFTYAYRDEYVYKIGPHGLEVGYPKYVTEVFPGAPKQHLRAVTYIPENRRTYMYKDSRVWRYTDFRLDEGYPRVWTSNHYYRPSAALTLTYRGNSQIFMFGHNYFWEWNPYTEDIVPGYPLPLETYFPYAPFLPDAAFMNTRGNFIFFKYNSFKKMEHRGLDSESQPIGPSVFGPLCGGRPNLLKSVLDEPLYDLPLGDEPIFDRDFVELTEPEFSPLIKSLINDNNRKQGEDGGHGGRFHGNGWIGNFGRGLGVWNRLGRRQGRGHVWANDEEKSDSYRTGEDWW